MDLFEMEAWHWLLLTLLCLMFEGFYSMQEMAVLSYNRLELVYDCARGSKRAGWIAKLVRHPDRLFTTTLLTVNLVLQLGSECSRRFYEAMNMSSNLAPLTQVILVVICAELAPTLAGRLYARKAALLGAPILYATSIILVPATAVVTWVSNRVNRLLGYSQESFTLVSCEDLKAVIKREQPLQANGQTNDPENFLEAVGNNIFSMDEVAVKDIAKHLHACSVVSSKATCEQMRQIFDKTRSDFVLVIDPQTGRSLGIILPRFLFDVSQRSHSFAYQLVKPVLVVRSSDSLMKVILPLRQSRYSMAIVVDSKGLPVGCLTFDEIAHYLFGAHHGHAIHTSGRLVERTFDPKVTLGLLRHSWGLEFGHPDEWTLERFLNHVFEHRPEIGQKYMHRGIELELKEDSNKELTVSIRAFVQL